MNLIKPIITSLPFVEHNFFTGPPVEEQYYFEKAQCISDCYYGTITDRNHLPPFIVKVPLTTSLFTNNALYTICPDGTNAQVLTPKVQATVKAVIYPSEVATYAAIPPANGDLYYIRGNDFISKWNTGSGMFEEDLPFTTGMLITDQAGGFTWIKKDSIIIRTNKGIQFCTIGGENYAIYSGYEFNQTINCGLRHVVYGGPNLVKRSQLVDVREFDVNSNEYNKLYFTNTVNLGNIPYSGVFFEQRFYFEKKTLLGEPDTSINTEKEEDGLGNEKIVFQKRTKTYQLDTEPVPEYISDFLEFAQMHDIKRITTPFASQAKDIDTLEVKNTWLSSACYGTVNLKLILEEDIIKTSCPQIIDKAPCIEVSFDVKDFKNKDQQAAVEALPPAIGDSYMILNTGAITGNQWENHVHAIATWSLTGWKYTEALEDMRIVKNGGDDYFFNGTAWVLLPTISCSAGVSGIDIIGQIPNGVTAMIHQRVNGTTPWFLFAVKTKSELATGVTFTGTPLVNYDFRILALSNNCDYGYSTVVSCVMPNVGS